MQFFFFFFFFCFLFKHEGQVNLKMSFSLAFLPYSHVNLSFLSIPFLLKKADFLIITTTGNIFMYIFKLFLENNFQTESVSLVVCIICIDN